MEELLELLRQHPEGLRIGELAKAVGARSEGIRRLLEYARTTHRVRLVSVSAFFEGSWIAFFGGLRDYRADQRRR